MTIKSNLISNRAVTRTLQRSAGAKNLFDIIIRSIGVEMTEELREAVARKIGRVRKYAPRAFRARVHFEREHLKAKRDQFRVTVRYEIPGRDLTAEHRADEPLAALNVVSEKIERRLRKRKTARLASRLGRKARACRIADFCELNESDPGRR
jgi:ribosomal subunit interface protein